MRVTEDVAENAKALLVYLNQFKSNNSSNSVLSDGLALLIHRAMRNIWKKKLIRKTGLIYSSNSSLTNPNSTLIIFTQLELVLIDGRSQANTPIIIPERPFLKLIIYLKEA